MATINKETIRRRVASIYDLVHGAQADSKAIKEYVRKLERSVDLHKERAGNTQDFLRDFGGGI